MKDARKIAVWGDPIDYDALEQIRTCGKDERVLSAAMMDDHHKGYSVPIGGVLELTNAVSPSAVAGRAVCNSVGND